MLNPYLFLIVGASGSGKGTLVKALQDMGDTYVTIVSKITTRKPKPNDGSETISIYPKKIKDMSSDYDIIYKNFGNTYAISTNQIFDNLKNSKFQVLIVSNSEAIKKLHQKFGSMVKLVYLFTPVDADKALEHQKNVATENDKEIQLRIEGIKKLQEFYIKNIQIFDHVLLNIREPEDMFDQVFKLFKIYR